MNLPIAREGWPFIVTAVVLAVLLTPFSSILSIPVWVLAALIINFFRDPRRVTMESEAAVLAPADGKIIVIGDSDMPDAFPRHRKISIFMNVFNVHVNRAPMPGTITAVDHFPGSFRPAWEDAASHGNERTEIRMDTAAGPVMVRLVAGLVARRIKPYISPGQTVERGDRISIIKFGSRVDLYLPAGMKIDAVMGEHVHAGLSRIATLLPTHQPEETP